VTTPTGAAFDVVLMAHIGFVLVGLASVLVTGTQAWRARAGPSGAGAGSVTRFFRPGINWPGRALYLVVILGVALVSMSQGAYRLDDSFVELGFVLWVAAVAIAELLVWPGERILQRVVSQRWLRDPVLSSPAESTTQKFGLPDDVEAKRIATRVALSSWLVCGLIVSATVVMVQKP